MKTATAKTNVAKATTKTRKATAAPKAAPKAKAKAPAKAAPKAREISNKVKPLGTTDIPQPKAPAKAAPKKAAPKASSTTAPKGPVKPSTGDATLDKRYGVGQSDTLPEDFRGLDTYSVIERINGDEADLKTNWNQIAKFYGFSVVPVIESLVAAGKWPTKDKTNRKGEVMKDNNDNAIKVPCTYKEVYNAEKEANVPAIGHWVNRASNRFAEYKPEDLKRASNAKTGPKADKDLKAKKRKSSLELAIEYVAGLDEKEIEQFISDPLVKDALKKYLK